MSDDLNTAREHVRRARHLVSALHDREDNAAEAGRLVYALDGLDLAGDHLAAYEEVDDVE